MKLTGISEICANVVEAFASCAKVQGIALCGSYSDELHDNLSDIDIWIYHTINGDESNLKDLIEKRPQHSSIKAPHSADYILIEYIEQRVLVSIKFINATHLDAFIRDQKSLQFDEMLFEDVETLLKWRILWEKENFLTSITRLARQTFETGRVVLLNKVERRYGDLVWRSAFQGIYRGDQLQWSAIIHSVVSVMVVANALGSGRPPPAMKWRLSSRYLEKIGAGQTVRALISEIRDARTLGEMFHVYEHLRKAEDEILPWAIKSHKWWWAVFDFAELNLTLGDEAELRCREFSNYIGEVSSLN